MTADVALGCYSTVPEYKVTEGRERLMPSEDFGTSTKTVVVDQTTSEELLVTITATYPVAPGTATFGTKAASELVGASVMPMLMLVRHQSDLRETGSGTTPTRAASTSNAAAKVALNSHKWDGVGALLGISTTAMVLGAAVIIPW
jgi:hypothetical protein